MAKILKKIAANASEFRPLAKQRWAQGGIMGGILGLLVLVLDIIAIVDVLKSSLDTSKKALWIILILILPVIGMVVYFLIGKKQ